MRNRNWVLAAVLVGAVLIFGVVFGKSKQGGGVGAASVEFGVRVRPGSPPASLDYTNGWVATSGAAAIGVYAGSQAHRHINGLLVIVRTTDAGKRITQKVLRGAGAVMLLRPSPSRTESAAFGASLRFVTASGDTGTLELANDTVTLNS